LSELINNAEKRKELLKHMILELHKGQAPEAVKEQLVRMMGKVPTADIVEVEQQLINEGLPQEEVLKLCDIHTQALKGIIDHGDIHKTEAGHPEQTFRMENRALAWEIDTIRKVFGEIESKSDGEDVSQLWIEIRNHLNALMDVGKHYLRKEHLLFPFLESHGINGPPKVMWGKHDQTRAKLKTALQAISTVKSITSGEAKQIINSLVSPAVESIEEMIYKENEILLPMCLKTLSDSEWHQIYQQSPEVGFCLYDPPMGWKPASVNDESTTIKDNKRIQLPSGSFTLPELQALLNTIPFDLTFVDKNDRVSFFTQGKERIFARNRAIIGRNVQNCHPPSSVDMVEKILDDFKSGKEDKCAFWINMKDKFILIEYFAMRDEAGGYLGCLEVSQDLTEKRQLQGERRILNYSNQGS